MTEFQRELITVAELNEKTRGIVSELSSITLERLATYMLERNKTLNLTAIKDESGIILKHLVDSSAVSLEEYIPRGARVIDIGCGGGFPSLVIATLRRDVSVLGVDSVTKKVNYVNDAGKFLGLNNISVTNKRAEELGQASEHREKYDVATARAVGRLNLLCELCLPLVKVGGSFVAMKSQSTSEELEEAKGAIELLGGVVERVDRYTLKNDIEELERSIIVIRKTKSTPQKYPRNNSQIAKKPL